jgi:mRNA interferase RelE/StbE
VVYQIKIKKSVEKELRALPYRSCYTTKEAYPFASQQSFPFGYKKMKGFTNQFRIRIGHYRVIYGVEHKERLIHILKIGNRKDIYR